MKGKRTLVTVLALGLLLTLVAGISVAQGSAPGESGAPQAPMGTAFTYQGRLEDGGVPVDGICNFTFTLYDQAGSGSPPAGGTPLGTQTKNGVEVSEGLFTVLLDFGVGAFTGDARWLEVAVDCGGGATTLAPRQELTPVPHALALPGVFPLHGNVGIGTTSPAFQLSLGSSTANTKLALYETGADNSYGLGVLPGSFRLHLNGSGARFAFLDGDDANASEILTIKGNGNVGIGTTSPPFQLSLGPSTANTKFALYETGADNSYGLGVLPGSFRLHLNGSGARFAFLDGDDANASEIVTIKGNGNVGIGTVSPPFQLSLGPSTANTKLALYETGADNSYGLGVLPGSFRLHLNGSGARFAFLDGDDANASEIVTIKGSGNVGIGTTDPAARLHVAGTTRTSVLEITGGSDLAEPFEIAGARNVEPGMVVAIDLDYPGQLRIANKAYDRAVAGCVSGGNGLNPGLTMQQEGTVADGAFPVALSGRVYCWADAAYGPIQPGDLLTTSDTPGHVMKVTDTSQAQGAIIGKAMGALPEGQGLILVLVSLQ